MTKYDKAEKKVQKVLTPLLRDEFTWDVLLDMLQRRAMIKVLADRRRELGLTQADLAERMDVSQSWISELETQDWPDIRMSTYRRWAMALELRYEWRLADIAPEPMPEASSDEPNML